MAKKTIKQRAEAIIADAKRYDVSTREAISNSLKRDTAADLAVCVERAEDGETIFDLVGEQAKLEIAAQFIIDLFVVEEVPNFLKLAVESTLDGAAESAGVTIWNEQEGYILRAMADLFAMTRELTLDKKDSSAETLAAHIAAILEHPETPDALYNDIAERITDMSSHVDFQTPEMIERSLVAYAGRESCRKGGAR